MHAVILGGKRGGRITGVGDDVPAPLLPVGGRPLVWHHLQGLLRAGFRRFVLCLEERSWQVKRHFLDHHLAGCDLTLRGRAATLHGKRAGEEPEITLVETAPDPSFAGCLRAAERFLQGEDFLVSDGLCLADADLETLVRSHRRHGGPASALVAAGPARYAGYHVFGRAVLGRLGTRFTLSLEECLAELESEGDLLAVRHEGFWSRLESTDDHRRLNAAWAEGRAWWLGGEATRVHRVAA